MKTKLTQLLFVFLAAFALLFACQKKIDIENPLPPPGPEQPITVKANFAGRVFDALHKPVSGAQVTIGSSFVLTSINGNFEISQVDVTNTAAFIKISKDGYFDGSRTISVKAGSHNYVEVEMIPAAISGSFNAPQGGILTFSGASVEFPANAIIGKTDSLPYTGTVDVKTYVFNPAAAGFEDRMPGTLRGTTTNDEQRALQSFSMLAVELSGAGNKPLQLAAGKKATLHFPIPAELVGKAPANIPLWYFDEKTGLWKEEGNAVKSGSEYIGTVGHFSFWNCDDPYQFVSFEAKIVDQSGNKVSNTKIRLSSSKYGATAAFTDTTGLVSGFVPSGEALTLEVMNACNTVIATKALGPYNTAANAGEISVDLPISSTVTISGIANDCANQPVVNGYASVIMDGIAHLATIENGNFSITFTRCTGQPDSARIELYNTAAGKETSTRLDAVTSGNYSTGTITLCEEMPAPYCSLNLNGTEYNFTFPVDSSRVVRNGGWTYIYLNTRDFKKGLTFSFGPDTIPGAKQSSSFSFVDYTISNIKKQRYTLKDSAFINILQYGIPNQMIKGNFSTRVIDSTNVVSGFSGNFLIPIH